MSKKQKPKVLTDFSQLGEVLEPQIKKCKYCSCTLDEKGECYRCFQQWVNLMCN